MNTRSYIRKLRGLGRHVDKIFAKKKTRIPIQKSKRVNLCKELQRVKLKWDKRTLHGEIIDYIGSKWIRVRFDGDRTSYWIDLHVLKATFTNSPTHLDYKKGIRVAGFTPPDKQPPIPKMPDNDYPRFLECYAGEAGVSKAAILNKFEAFIVERTPGVIGEYAKKRATIFPNEFANIPNKKLLELAFRCAHFSPCCSSFSKLATWYVTIKPEM